MFNVEIYLDQWGAYMSLNEEGYLHETVNHSEAFKSPTGCCTNTVEGLWSLAKLKLKKMKGVLDHRLPALRDEFMYTYHYGFNNADVLMRLLSDLGKYYGKGVGIEKIDAFILNVLKLQLK